MKTNNNYILIIIFFLSYSFTFIDSKAIKVKANSAQIFCYNNIFYFQINVKYSSQLQKNYPFILEITYPKAILFRCMIAKNSNKILCYASLENNNLILQQNEGIELPYPFPNIVGIEWDYESFLSLIYRRVWKLESTCGDDDLEYSLGELNSDNWGFISNINSINNKKCNYDNDISFNFNFASKLIGGKIYKQKKEIKKNGNEEFKVEFLHNLIIPFELGKYNPNEKKPIFKINKQYNLAICSPKNNEINLNNYNSFIDFNCKIPLKNQQIFAGPLRIKSFYDYIFVNIITKNTNELKLIKIYFNTDKNQLLTTVGGKAKDQDIIINQITNKNNIRRLDDNNGTLLEFEMRPNSMNIKDNGKSYYILDNDLNSYYCPDRPVIKILNINDGGIKYVSNKNNNKFQIEILGIINYGYNTNEDMFKIKDKTNKISFPLIIEDNLISDTKNKKNILYCKFQTFIDDEDLDEEIAKIECPGEKSDKINFNTDLNINQLNNQFFENEIIVWPKDAENKIRIYNYNLKILSMKKNDYGCFENKFYFYIFIYDLKYEPNIKFSLPLKSPQTYSADCELYKSNILKCYIDLRLKKITKGTYITLSNETITTIETKDGNQINLHMRKVNFFDTYLIAEEDCGDYIIVGALKDVGFSYWQIIFIIFGCITFVTIVGLFICYLILYRIIHKNRKGKYYSYKDEVNANATIGANAITTVDKNISK